jgi:hypothetical protein
MLANSALEIGCSILDLAVDCTLWEGIHPRRPAYPGVERSTTFLLPVGSGLKIQCNV